MHLRILNAILLSIAGMFIIIYPAVVTDGQHKTQNIKASGANKLSFKLNDHVVRDSSLTTMLQEENGLFYFTIIFGDKNNDRLTFVITDSHVSERTFVLDDPSRKYLSVTIDSVGCSFTSDEYYNGMLMIHDYDRSGGVISGGFELVASSRTCDKLIKITEGVFDVRFRTLY